MAEARVVFVTSRHDSRIDSFVRRAPEGVQVTVVDRSTSPERLAAALQEADALLVLGVPVPEAALRQARRLRLVQVVGEGYDRLPLDVIRELGVPLCNAGGVLSTTVAEHALMLMLATLRRMVPALEGLRRGQWRDDLAHHELHELAGKTVGIVGLGNIGRRVARLLGAFDASVIFHDILTFPEEVTAPLRARPVPFEELLRTADIVTLHTPLTDTTRGMMGERQFALMKPTAILVNTSRGRVVQEEALVRALQEGRLAGAGLDVFQEEPLPPDSPLLRMENVVCLPHLGGTAFEAWGRLAERAWGNVAALLEGRPLQAVVLPGRR